MTSLERRENDESLIGITDEKVEWELCLLRMLGGDYEKTRDYIERANDIIRAKQSVHFEELEKRKIYVNPYIFDLALAIFYNLLSDEQINNPLTSSDIEVSQQSIEEFTITTNSTRTVKLGWYIDMLEKDEPALYDLISNKQNFLGTQRDVGEFGLSMIYVSMPYLLRAEAIKISHRFDF